MDNKTNKKNDTKMNTKTADSDQIQKPIIIIENIRSAYNTGNIIRTAEVLGWEVILSGYTPRTDHKKVQKTALGAEDVVVGSFWNTSKALEFVKNNGYFLIAAECTDQSIALDSLALSVSESLESGSRMSKSGGSSLSGENSFPVASPVALIVGNEKTGVLQETLDYVDVVCHIPLRGKKDSLNVGQAAAIMMWELKNNYNVGA